MNLKKENVTKQTRGNEKDMPHRVAPRLKGVVKNKGIKKK